MMNCKWHEYLSSDAENIKNFCIKHNVDLLAIDDCFNKDQQPKFDDYGSHQLLVWFFLYNKKTYEIQILIFEDKLLLVPHENPPKMNSWKDFFEINEYKETGFTIYQTLNKATDFTWNEIKTLCDQIDEFEQMAFKSRINPFQIQELKKTLNNYEYSIGHLSSVVRQLQSFYILKQGEEKHLTWKYRDLQDRCERLTKYISLYRSQISTIIDLYWGLQANKTNGQIKRLTLLASISVPITLWSSFWGMNFESIPFKDNRLFAFAIILMLISVGLALFFLIRKGYWED